MRTFSILLFALLHTSLQSTPTRQAAQPLMQACPIWAPSDPALPKLPNLTPAAKPVQFQVEFTQEFVDKSLESWQRGEQDKICAAAAYVQQVWSSKEFEDAVMNKDWVIESHEEHHRLVKTPITGPSLWAGLMSHQPIKLRLSITSNLKLVPNYALSDENGWTAISRRYVAGSPKLECPRTLPLLSCLVHSLSHEYTHYDVAVTSADSESDAVDNDAYVSYGIGDLTENLAFPPDGSGSAVAPVQH